jgi:hypothetical protein
MKLIGIIILAIASFSGAFILVWEMNLPESVLWFWLCALLSLIVLAIGLFVRFRQRNARVLLVAVTVIVCTAIVLVGDIVAGVAVICSHKVCI